MDNKQFMENVTRELVSNGVVGSTNEEGERIVSEISMLYGGQKATNVEHKNFSTNPSIMNVFGQKGINVTIYTEQGNNNTAGYLLTDYENNKGMYRVIMPKSDPGINMYEFNEFGFFRALCRNGKLEIIYFDNYSIEQIAQKDKISKEDVINRLSTYFSYGDRHIKTSLTFPNMDQFSIARFAQTYGLSNLYGKSNVVIPETITEKCKEDSNEALEIWKNRNSTLSNSLSKFSDITAIPAGELEIDMDLAFRELPDLSTKTSVQEPKHPTIDITEEERIQQMVSFQEPMAEAPYTLTK